MRITVQPITSQRSNVMGHAFMFVAGFTLVFVFLGATAGLFFGSFFQSNIIDTLVAVGGVLLLILGIHMSGIIKTLVGSPDNIKTPTWVPRRTRALPDLLVGAIRLLAKLINSAPAIRKQLIWIDRKLDELILPERRKQAGYGQSPGLIRSSVVGMTFAAGWTPCIGPLLGAILSLSLSVSSAQNPMATVFQSAILLFAYSMGLAIPFLVAAWILGKAAGSIRGLNKYIPLVEKISAFFLIALGLLLLFGSLSELNRFFSSVQPDWIYDIEISLRGYGITLPIAFAAGLLSFLSPCVLPLIPVYVGYLTGVTASGNVQTAG